MKQTSNENNIEDNIKNKNQQKIDKVGKRKEQSKNEKELEQIISGMKRQIEKLQEVIKMICNTIVQEESVRKEVENQLEKIEKEVETNNNDITNTNSNNEDKANEKEAENDNNDKVQKVGKVRRYP